MNDINLNLKIFQLHISDGCLWFRIFGYGLSIRNIYKHPLLFSFRNGNKKYVMIKNTIVTYLYKTKLPKYNAKCTSFYNTNLGLPYREKRND